MRILFISSLYPSSAQPDAAPYNRQLIGALAKHADVRVIAPVPWFPGQRLLRGRALPPVDETLGGIRVSHPRVFYTPGFLVHRHWRLYRDGVRPCFTRALSEFRPDHVIIGFAYPDAVAVAPLCREAGLAYSIRVNGSDFRIRVQQALFRDLVLTELKRAPRVFCPGEALKRDMIAAGIDESRITSFRNGVDRSLFNYSGGGSTAEKTIQPQIDADGRRCEGNRDVVPPYEAGQHHDSCLSDSHPRGSAFICGHNSLSPHVLFVGNLVPVKGPDRLIEAFAVLVSLSAIAHGATAEGQAVRHSSRSDGRRSEVGGQRSEVRETTQQLSNSATPCLVMIGGGPMMGALERRAAELGISERVTFVGPVSQKDVAAWMNKAGVLCLPSRSEGMPNVVAEALASGLPVVATDVGEVPFMIRDGINGFVVSNSRPDIPSALADAIRKALDRDWNREQIAAGSGIGSWDDAASAILRGLTLQRES